MIKDSGNRRTFSTGAVRDIQEGKGRCDLIPLDVLAKAMGWLTGGDNIITHLAAFLKTRNTKPLYAALSEFSTLAYEDSLETMFLEVAIHFEEGAKKYGPNNWQKGLPVSCYVDSAVRHYLKYRRGDKDESHSRAFVWNVICCIWEVDHHYENKNS